MTDFRIGELRVDGADTEARNHSSEEDNEDWIKPLIHQSQGAKEFAYCPYSKFRVGAALLAHDGTVFTGEGLTNNIIIIHGLGADKMVPLIYLVQYVAYCFNSSDC